eukprot:scaffold126112_cov17-Tisochrysis_lutea.AAC.1
MSGASSVLGPLQCAKLVKLLQSLLPGPQVLQCVCLLLTQRPLFMFLCLCKSKEAYIDGAGLSKPEMVAAGHANGIAPDSARLAAAYEKPGFVPPQRRPGLDFSEYSWVLTHEL